MKHFMFLALVSAAISAGAQTLWTADPAHSNVKFTAIHLSVSEVEGKFTRYQGSMKASNPDFTDAQIEFRVEVASINTDNEMRDNHLRSDDFFNSEKFPYMTFKSSSFKKVSDRKYVLEGDLTIRDVTKHVSFDVKYGGTVLDSRGTSRAGFVATTSINRFDYNLKWNKMAEAAAVVGPEISIRINAEFIRTKD